MYYNKIENLRKQRKISQEGLAELAGISYQGLRDIKKTNNPTVKTLESISKALSVPMTYWFEDISTSMVSEPPMPVYDKIYINERIKELQEERDNLKDLVRSLKKEIEVYNKERFARSG